MEKKESSFGVGSFLAGAAIGAVLGVLFAPDKGSETRRKIKEKFEDYEATLQKLKQEYDELKEKGVGIVKDEQQHKASRMIYEIEELLERIKKEKAE